MDFDSVFRKYHHPMYLYTLKFVEDKSDAQDIVQNVFLSVWENKKFSSDEKIIHAYLFNSIKNSCLNYIKHKNVIRKFEQTISNELKEMEAIHYQSGEKSLIEKGDLKQLEDAINSLPEIYKEVIMLSRFDGLKNKVIAVKLQVSVRTVETRIYRALVSIKEKFSTKTFFVLMTLISVGKLKSQKS